MKQMQYVDDCLVAVQNVRREALKAYNNNDFVKATKLTDDLSSLYICLEIELVKLKQELTEIV